MKTLLIIFLSISTSMAQELKYEAQKENYAAKHKYLNVLSKIKLTKIIITKSRLSEAMFYLSKGAENKQRVGLFDFAISYPLKTGDGSGGLFSESPEEKKKYDPIVSLKEKDATVLAAIDSICKQAGYVWSVEFDDNGKPFVMIEYKVR